MPAPAQTNEAQASTRQALLFQTLHAQLERMRAMHYKYSDLFYQLIILGIVMLILMAAASMTQTLRAVVLLIPFFIIYIGAQSAYFLTYVVWARIYATGLEQRLNGLLEAEALIAHRQEAAYLFPLDGPQFAGVTLRLRQTFIGFITIHFWLLGSAAIALSLYRAWQLYEELMQQFPPVCYYFIALGAWALLHLIYLVWYFGSRHYERRIMQIVRDAYGTNYEQA
ncbi:MAG: hypothetical protein QOF02_767 [Blastocatellia bacterium]|jgi:hypothetical protein|nr:hypothetical protein [Blastocatellia bacterium]